MTACHPLTGRMIVHLHGKTGRKVNNQLAGFDSQCILTPRIINDMKSRL
jgi:hypothetical protein